MQAFILSWPQAALDYYPYIDKKVRMGTEVIHSSSGIEHADIIRRGIDSRMDLYRVGFVMMQIMALLFLFLSVLKRNRQLQARFKARTKLRLL